MEIRSLSERYAEAVLRFMLSSGSEIKYSELKPIVNNYPTLEKLMVNLEKDKLVVTRKVLKPYKTNYAKLTPMGVKVANKLQDIENLMTGKVSDSVAQGSIPADRPSTAVPGTSSQPSRRLLDPNLSLVLRVVYERQHLTFSELSRYTKLADAELRLNLDALVADGSVRTEDGRYLMTEKGAKLARHVIAMENGQDVIETDYEESETVRNTVKGSE